MATEILMPRQGQSVESCIILEWKKQAGDSVEQGETVCEVETDKATFEVEAPESGTLLEVYREEGDEVPVLEPIALVGQPGEKGREAPEPREQQQEKQSPAKPAEPVEPEKKVDEQEQETQVKQAVSESERRGGISPRAKKTAEAKGVDPAVLSGSGPHGRIIERDVLKAAERGEPMTPAARAKSAAGGAGRPDRGSGIGGRVTAADMGREPAAQQEQPAEGQVTERKVSGIRKLISERMHESLQTTAQLTLHSSADAQNILSYRKQLKEAPDEHDVAGITINGMVMYAAVKTLQKFPFMNAHMTGESILEYGSVHLGFAVDTPRGLMVPVIQNAQDLSLKELSAEAKRLGTACLEGNIKPDELSGGTFTVTNLGALDVEMFTPVLNPPQVAILGVCSAVPKPVIRGTETVFTPHMGLSLTIDHRAVDGAPAARFLKALKDALADFTITLAV
ncbi:MAG: dihydrolipoamide acetyltransferase family protein [Spirochaetia bacterium]